MTDRVETAVRWLAVTGTDQRPRPIIPHLRKTFAITAKEAVEAIRQADQLRVQGGG